MTVAPEILIFIAFLFVNLGIGVACSKSVSNIREYAIGQRNFTTPTIVATLIATAIAGSTFAFNVQGTYQEGLYYMIPVVGDGLSYFIIAFYFAPKLSIFFNRVSVADAMGGLYGEPVRIVSAIIAILPAIGTIAVQFTILNEIIQYFFPVSVMLSLVLSILVIMSYSSLGGIKAVTFTDIVQFIAFGVFIPLLLFIIWGAMSDDISISQFIATNDTWQVAKVFSPDNNKLYEYLWLFFFFAIPAFDPAIFQRILIAKNSAQIKNSFIVAGTLCVILYCLLNGVGFLLAASGAVIETDYVIPHILTEYTKPGLKAAMAIGLIAMIMSTADSYLNSASVMVVHDILRPLRVSGAMAYPLLFCRMATIILCAASVALSMSQSSILDILLLSYGFYMPVVSVPLIFSLLGFRRDAKIILQGMLIGGLMVCLIKYFLPEMDSILLPMICNALYIYFMRDRSVEQTDSSHASLDEQAKGENIKESVSAMLLKGYNALTGICKLFNIHVAADERAREAFYLGIICMCFIISSTFSLPHQLVAEYETTIYNMLYFALCCTSTMIMLPLLPPALQGHKMLSIFLLIALGYLCVVYPVAIMGLGHYSMLQILLLCCGVTLLFVLMHWRLASSIIAISIACAVYITTVTLFNHEAGGYYQNTNHWQATYILFIVLIVTLMFIHPLRFLSLNQSHGDLHHWDNQRYDFKFSLSSLEALFHPHGAQPSRGGGSGAELHPKSDRAVEMTALNHLNAKSGHLSYFMENLLPFVDLAHHNIALRKKFIPVNMVVDNATIASSEAMQHSHDFILETCYFENTQDLYCDIHYLSLGIKNAICEAISLSQSGSEIIINIRKASQHYQKSHRTNSMGTLIEVKYRIVDRDDTPNTKEGEGENISFALTSLIITKHGGYLWQEAIDECHKKICILL